MTRSFPLLLCLALAATSSVAQTSTPTDPVPPPAVEPVPAVEPPPAPLPASTTTYISRTESRFGALAGSSESYASLVNGLRTGGEIQLDGASFTAPTRPMGYGNITRALDLAQRQLAAQGIANPTPAQLQAALVGGAPTGQASGTTTGILQMRASGMGWGQIARAIGVSPGMGKAPAVAVAPTSPSTSTSTSAPTSSLTPSTQGSGIVTASGARVYGASSTGRAYAAGQGAGQGLAKGTANLAGPGGAVTAGGQGLGNGAASTGNRGQGHAFGRAK